ncbi:MAG: hypothetical protein Ct9H90mP18_06090 [Gammaproteobacteria bacterium]|nr:MAG: hypothetical protein Ct9H90mP18_06090 [Gammaproteobacteria bacterium]
MLDKVQIRIVNNLVKSIPTYATKGSAGLDLRAAVKDKIHLKGPMKHYLFQQVYQFLLMIKTTQQLYFLAPVLDIKMVLYLEI